MNIKRKIFLGSRKSNLAKKQASLVKSCLLNKGINDVYEKHITSLGDNVGLKEFKLNGGKGMFTKEIDNLLINKEIDLAVHSAKDIPAFIDKRIKIAAFLPREDIMDVLVTKDFSIKSILDIKKNVKFGSSSPRRVNYLKRLFSFAKFINIRGNIESRIKKVRDNKIDATLLALAGIQRLALSYNDINFIKIPTNLILPAPGQGAIAIMCRKDDKEIIEICKKIDHKNTRIEVSAERSFIKKINGNCFTPLAAFAKIKGRMLEINGSLFSTDGKGFSKARVIGSLKDPFKVGEDCAKKILKGL